MYNILLYGVNCVPSIFQRVTEQVIHGILLTSTYIDNIVANGVTIIQKTMLEVTTGRFEVET